MTGPRDPDWPTDDDIEEMEIDRQIEQWEDNWIEQQIEEQMIDRQIEQWEDDWIERQIEEQMID